MTANYSTTACVNRILERIETHGPDPTALTRKQHLALHAARKAITITVDALRAANLHDIANELQSVPCIATSSSALIAASAARRAHIATQSANYPADTFPFLHTEECTLRRYASDIAALASTTAFAAADSTEIRSYEPENIARRFRGIPARSATDALYYAFDTHAMQVQMQVNYRHQSYMRPFEAYALREKIDVLELDANKRFARELSQYLNQKEK